VGGQGQQFWQISEWLWGRRRAFVRFDMSVAVGSSHEDGSPISRPTRLPQTLEHVGVVFNDPTVVLLD
jgi:hypothetical protein